MRLLSLIVAIILTTACQPDRPVDPAPPEEGGTLVVATGNGSTTRYRDRDGDHAGPEHDLVTRFAADHGWDVEWRTFKTPGAMIEALKAGRAHLAAAGLTHLPDRDQALVPGATHTEVVEQVVCHRDDRPLPSSVEELPGVELVVAAGSSYTATLDRLSDSQPDLTYATDATDDGRGTEILLTEVARGEVECTVADSNIVRMVQRHWPHLMVAMSLGTPRETGWYAAPGGEALARLTREWRESAAGQAAVEAMRDRYYAHLGEFDFVDMRALNRRIDDRLPDYLPLFERAAAQTGMPTDLLAAMAYQESHWDPQAESPTGVRGMMMLTRNTAASLGVDDRLDPVESILGGARYLADRHDRLPADIPEPDRTYLALASYNIGRAHVLDARKLARSLDRNPDSWSDMREVLPLKADKRYYPQTKYGYARGYEPVHYVQRIRNYRDVIARAMGDE